MRTGEGLEGHLATQGTDGLTTASGHAPSRLPKSGRAFGMTQSWRAWHANHSAEQSLKREARERREKVREERERAAGEARRARAFRGKVT